MLTPNLMTLYVEDIEISTSFYEKLFACPPVARYPNYVSFKFENGLYISLWSKNAKNFVSDGTGQRFELSFMVQSDDTLKSIYHLWQDDSVHIEQPLHEAVFGLTCVATVPDGHRIRLCTTDK